MCVYLCVFVYHTEIEGKLAQLWLTDKLTAVYIQWNTVPTVRFDRSQNQAWDDTG